MKIPITTPIHKAMKLAHLTTALPLSFGADMKNFKWLEALERNLQSRSLCGGLTGALISIMLWLRCVM